MSKQKDGCTIRISEKKKNLEITQGDPFLKQLAAYGYYIFNLF